jgi:hypothetical protein
MADRDALRPHHALLVFTGHARTARLLCQVRFSFHNEFWCVEVDQVVIGTDSELD